jgi:hypothetical protein
MDGLSAALAAAQQKVERGVTAGMRRATEGLKLDLRSQVANAGLGRRLPNSWQGRTYPVGGTSLNPAGFVWSKAPKIIQFFSTSTTVRSTGGKFLAIPTDNVAKGRGGARLTPAEVEQRFGRKLRFVNPASSSFQTPSVRRPGVAYLVMDDLVIRKATQRFRKRGAGDRKRGRQGQSVIMFILVKQVQGQKLLDLDAAAARWGALVPGLIDQEMGE